MSDAPNKVLVSGEKYTIATQEKEVRIVSVGTVLGTGGTDKSFTFTQSSPATSWSITHNLSKKPSVTVVDSADTVVVGDVEYNDLNSLTITFTAAFSGKAYLN